jgi:hypothetical protein
LISFVVAGPKKQLDEQVPLCNNKEAVPAYPIKQVFNQIRDKL